MEVLPYAEVRANLAAIMDRVVAERTPVTVTRREAEPVVMVALSDWNGMAETMHLLSTPANAARLQAGIAQLEAQAPADSA